ncbi:MAG: VRR-NUC domain-containing protein, partial [Pseudomonadota bacterium]|nr:VRR-NUC domain-containing protein [Pseudomonadota bacterium]
CTTMFDRILLSSVFWTAIDHAHSLNMALGRNGRPIGFQEAAKRKARGVKSGLPDYLFWHQRRAFAIELKTADGVLSDAQKDVLRELIANGVEVAVCWTIDQVFARLCLWNLCRKATVTA